MDKKESMLKLKITVLIVIILIGGVKGWESYKDTLRSKNKNVVLERVKGDLEASLHIVEYIDFQCSSCAYGSKYLAGIMKKYPKLIRLELKYFPLRMHQHAFMAARYGECSLQQGKFWDFHDNIIRQQEYWKKMIDAVPAFDSIARDIGVDETIFRQCLKNDKVEMLINKHRIEGRSLGVRSTPTYFINGEVFVGSKALKEFIEKYLANQE